MVLDGLRGYLQLANGLTDVTRERARIAAKSLVAQGEASVGAVFPESLKAQVGSLTEDLIATSKANRALLVSLVGAEVDRATARLGIVMTGELEAAKGRAHRLEQRVLGLERELREALSGSAPAATAAPAPTKKSTARRSPAKKSPAKKSPAKKSTAKKSTAKKATAKKATAKKSTAKKATAKKSTAKKATAKKATAKKATAKKATASTTMTAQTPAAEDST
jgi:polyhydroxyalkanoate synthesis regulator phasin